MKKLKVLLLIVTSLFIIACGSGNGNDDGGNGGGGSDSSSYFIIPHDGDQFKIDISATTKYTNLPDNNSSSVSYTWYSGTEMVSGIETLKGYHSSDGINGTVEAISYSSIANNEFRLYKTDYGINNSQDSGSYIYDPYLPTPTNMQPGQNYSYSYSYNNTYTGEQKSETVTYSNIQSDSITTTFGSYSDCLKFTQTYSGGSSMIWWYAKNIGAVRYISSGEGWSTTVDYKYTYY